MRPKPCSVAALALLPLLLAGCLQPGEPGEPIAAPPSPGAAVEGAPCASAWTTVRCQETGIVEVDGLGEACAVGARRCVDGRWGPCEGVEWVSADPLATTATGTEATGASRDALLGTPILCGGCDPDCYITSD